MKRMTRDIYESMTLPMQRAYTIFANIETYGDIRRVMNCTLAEYTAALECFKELFQNGETKTFMQNVARFFERIEFEVIPPHDTKINYTIKA